MAKNTVPTEFQAILPSSLVTQLNTERDKRYIIENLLKKAPIAAWSWMIRTYSQDEISDVIKQSKTLTPRDVNIWAELFNISQSEIACLQKSSHKTPESSWIY